MSTSPEDKRTEKPYHHGHLEEALVAAGLAMAREHGPEAVVLRAATRSAGVSPNAAYRHFADRGDLLCAVAKRCQGAMAEVMRARLEHLPPATTAETAWSRLRAVGRCYVEFALLEPGWFRTAFSVPLRTSELPEADDPRLFEILVDVLDELLVAGGITPVARPGAEFVAWSAVHGIATLLTTGPLQSLSSDEMSAAIERVVDAVRF